MEQFILSEKQNQRKKQPERSPEGPDKEELAREDYFSEVEREMIGEEKEDFTPRLRKEYIEEGVEFLVDARNRGAETMVFMDRSARPLAGFLRALWRRLYPDEPPPEMKFMVSSRLRAEYTGKDVAEAFAPAKNAFEGKTVLLVDEVVSSGATLNRAAEKLEEAFPTARLLKGGVASGGRADVSKFMDIAPPDGSGAYSSHGSVLGNRIYSQTAEVKEVSSISSSEIPISVHAQVRRIRNPKATYTYFLRQVGKHETLNDNSLDAIDKKIAAEEDMEKKSRLLQIREAYEKLKE